MPPGMVATGPVIPPAGPAAAPDDEEQAMRRSDDQPGSRPRRGRRLAAAALTVGLAGAAAAITGAGPSMAGSTAAGSTAAGSAAAAGGVRLSLAAARAELAAAVGAGYWHTSGNQILDSAGNPVRIAGINWYGFETPDEIAHGLWAQDYHTIINDIKDLGYNTIRIPFSNQMVENPIVPQNLSVQRAPGRSTPTSPG